jgi:hypothetical protein
VYNVSIEDAARMDEDELDILISYAPLLSGVLDPEKTKLSEWRALDSSLPDHGDSPAGWL